MAPPLVQVQDLTKIFRQGDTEILALDHLTLSISGGEFIALMGPSGSGKSTLLHLLAGIDRPSGGRCQVGGMEVGRLGESRLAEWRHGHVGFVFQSFNLIPVLTALENVELPLLLSRLSGRERREHALAALELVGLADRCHHLPRQLSGGQEQRVAIARAIVPDPELILADEPTGNLDAEAAHGVMEVLRDLNRRAGKTVVVVTHDPKAAAFASRTLHLEKGRLGETHSMPLS